MTQSYNFDIRVSAKRRALVRLAISSAFSIGLVVCGLYLLPQNAEWTSLVGILAVWDGWAFIGLIVLGVGSVTIIREVVFAINSVGQTGHWHFLLADDHLSWDVPNHPHGEEVGFRSVMSEISSIECRTIEHWEQVDTREYWLHFHDRSPVQLQSYSGVSLSWLASRIRDAGIEYRNTTIQG